MIDKIVERGGEDEGGGGIGAKGCGGGSREAGIKGGIGVGVGGALSTSPPLTIA